MDSVKLPDAPWRHWPGLDRLTAALGPGNARVVGGAVRDTLLGIPVSTTHTITGSIIGAGTARRASAVRWGVARNVIWAWFITIPASAAVGALFYLLTRLF